MATALPPPVPTLPTNDPPPGSLRVLVPVPNVPPGSVLQVRGPDNAIVQCVVPPGARPGIDVFPVDYASSYSLQSPVGAGGGAAAGYHSQPQLVREIWIVSVAGVPVPAAAGGPAPAAGTAATSSSSGPRPEASLLSGTDLLASSSGPRRASLVQADDPDQLPGGQLTDGGFLLDGGGGPAANGGYHSVAPSNRTTQPTGLSFRRPIEPNYHSVAPSNRTATARPSGNYGHRPTQPNHQPNVLDQLHNTVLSTAVGALFAGTARESINAAANSQPEENPSGEEPPSTSPQRGAAVGSCGRAAPPGAAGAYQHAQNPPPPNRPTFADQLKNRFHKRLLKAAANSDYDQLNYVLDVACETGMKQSPEVRDNARALAQTKLQEALDPNCPKRSKRLKAALILARRFEATDLVEYAQACQAYRALNEIPSGWNIAELQPRRGNVLVGSVELQQDLDLFSIQQLLDATFRRVYTRDRRGRSVPERLLAQRVIKVRNEKHWISYNVRKRRVLEEIEWEERKRESSPAGGGGAPPQPPQQRRQTGTTSALCGCVRDAMQGTGGGTAARPRFTSAGPRTSLEFCEVATNYNSFLEYGKRENTPYFQLSNVQVHRSKAGSGAQSNGGVVAPPSSREQQDLGRAEQQRPPAQSELEQDFSLLDPRINEVLLFHGTNALAADSIAIENFKVNLAGSASGTLFGRGIYFAENCSKSDEYARADPKTGLSSLLLCRTVLGRWKLFDQESVDPRACEDCVLRGDYHSVLGDRRKCRGTFREFVVFDDDQCYVEYVIWYKAVWGAGEK